MGVEIQDTKGRIVRKSKNLRGVITHSRYFGKPAAKFLANYSGGCTVSLEWQNGDYANVIFASDYVAWAWFEKRATERIRVISLG